jgi:type IV secretory pathway VirB3-like protein
MYADDLQFYPSASIFDLQISYDEVGFGFAADFWLGGANGWKFNPKRVRSYILIHQSKAQIPQPELYIGSDAIRVVTIVNNLGFVLNENLTAVITILEAYLADYFYEIIFFLTWTSRKLVSFFDPNFFLVITAVLLAINFSPNSYSWYSVSYQHPFSLYFKNKLSIDSNLNQ